MGISNICPRFIVTVSVKSTCSPIVISIGLIFDSTDTCANAFKALNNRQITNEELDKMRYDQARLAASQFADKRSEKYEALVKDLEAAGRRNEESYKSGKGVQRRPLSLPSAKGLNISKDKLKMLEAFQNSMVRNGNGSAAGNIA